MDIEVVYSPQVEKVVIVPVSLDHAATVAQAIDASGLLAQYPEIHWDTHTLSLHGKRTTAQAQLVDGDRVEILRPLLVDPMTARRLRAEKQARS